MADITSANAVFSLSIAGLVPAPVNLGGYSADDCFDTEDIKTAETTMGVDGHLSAGWVFSPVPQNITFQADSDSNAIFETLYLQERTLKKKFFLNAVVQFPSLGVSYTLTKGVVETYPPMSGAKKTLAPRRYGIVWESVMPGGAA
jgi:hypothetical protein